jgi:hypothetical protein
MQRHVVWQKFTDVLEVLAASVTRAIMIEATTFETSVRLVPDCRGQQPGGRISSFWPSREPEISSEGSFACFLGCFEVVYQLYDLSRTKNS